jgi:hypothetical protein
MKFHPDGQARIEHEPKHLSSRGDLVKIGAMTALALCFDIRQFCSVGGCYVRCSLGLPPEKWSFLMYRFDPEGGLSNAEEETHGGRDCREVAAG